MKKRFGIGAWFSAIALGIVWLVFPVSRGLQAQTIVISCSFDLPCEYTHGSLTSVIKYRNVAQFVAVVDRVKRPSLLQAFEHELFRFVLLVDMNGNSVIVTTYDKESGYTQQMESRLDALCAFPLKGTQYIPLQKRPALRVQRKDLYLDAGSGSADDCRGILATDLGLTAETLPDFVDVRRQGIAVRISAEIADGGGLDLDQVDELVPLCPDFGERGLGTAASGIVIPPGAR
jgi:hypothetical protein